MHEPLNARVEDGVLVVSGDIDMRSVPEFVRLVEALFPSLTPVVLDMAGVRFVDSLGLSALIRLRRRAGDQAISLWITRASQQVTGLLAVSGLAQMIHVGSRPSTGADN